jgi:DNA phosphorothioation-dependent restriction protein DptG
MNFKKIGNFYLAKIRNEIFLFSASFESSIKRDKEIQEFLKNIEFNGKIYIDTILTTGTAENRFLTAYFKNKITEIKIADSKTSEKISSFAYTFFTKNIKLLQNSHLTDRQIELLNLAS